MADVNRADDALPILRSVLEIDGPQEVKHTFCEEVVSQFLVLIEHNFLYIAIYLHESTFIHNSHIFRLFNIVIFLKWARFCSPIKLLAD